MPLNQDQIFHGFRNWLIKESELSWNQSLVDWTSKIKEYFGSVGNDKGYTPIFTCEEKKEYLVDIVWLCEKPDRYLSLALESELSERQSSILEDFTKLVDIKALLKIGLFRVLFSANKENIISKMKEILTRQMITFNETYLIIFLSYDSNKREIIVDSYDLDVKGINHRHMLRDSYSFPEE
jgi:hypothetical protein